MVAGDWDAVRAANQAALQAAAVLGEDGMIASKEAAWRALNVHPSTWYQTIKRYGTGGSRPELQLRSPDTDTGRIVALLAIAGDRRFAWAREGEAAA